MVRSHWNYLVYMLRHKWLVLRAGLRLQVPLSQLLLHDLSKFRSDEWNPYVAHFYGGRCRNNHTSSCTCVRDAFDWAAQLHVRRNPHHWDFWLLVPGSASAVEMPERYVREMVADWAATGKARTGDWGNIWDWYDANKWRMKLAPQTRNRVEELLREYNFGDWR